MSMIIHKNHLPDIDIDASSFIYENDYILIQDEYICDLLKCMNVPEIGGDDFHDICYLGCFKVYREVREIYALKSPNTAYYYALRVLKGRFELGEKIIATVAAYGYYYAMLVIRCRFEMGEQAIATDAEYSYHYAHDVLKGRFELGEPVILNSKYEEIYQEQFL